MGAPRVETTDGTAVGATVTTPSGPVERFLGLPYATAERFGAPRPAPPWSGEREALAFGPSPPQSTDGAFAGLVPGLEPQEVAEDCLTLNVWRPAGSEGAPVLVWIAGGAFVTGGTAQPAYDGARLAAEQGVVVVSINYRLGALGFLDLRSVSGADGDGTAASNRGLLDQARALRWVAANAAAIGGDPGRITLVGESAGAGSIVHLLASTLDVPARRAIVQSPGVDMTLPADLAAAVTATFLAKAQVDDLPGLRALPVEQLLAAQAATARSMLLVAGTMPFHPVVDGTVLPATPSEAFAAGRTDAVDLLIGTTTDELRLFPDPRAVDLDRDGLVRWVGQVLAARTAGTASDADAAALADAYLADGADWAELQADALMRDPTFRLADAHGGATFAYQFAWAAADDPRGAFHAVEIPFLFDTFDGTGWAEFLPIDDAGRDLGRTLRAAWASFAATGDPSTSALAWPPYDPSADRLTVRLDRTPEVQADPLGEVRARWRRHWSSAGRPAPVVV